MGITWQAILVTVLSSIILEALRFISVQVVEKIGGPNPMETFWKNFVVELWPIWIGLLIGISYYIIRRAYRVQQVALIILPTQIQNLEDRLNTFIETVRSLHEKQ